MLSNHPFLASISGISLQAAALLLLAGGGLAPAARAAAAPAPVTLESAIQSALANNPAYHKAVVARGVAAQNLAAARASLWPALTATASYLHTAPNDREPGGVSFVANNAPDEYVAQLGVTQPLYDGGLLRATAARGEADLAASAQDLDVATAALKLQVVGDYVAVLRAEQALAIARGQLTTSQAHLRESQVQLRQGTIAPLEAERNALDEANTRMAVEQAAGQLAIARTALATATGLSSDAQLAPLPAVTLPAGTEAALVARAYARRPEVRAASERTRSASFGARMAAAARAPQVGVTGAAGWDSALGFSPAQLGWDAGLNVSLPVFDWGRLEAQQRAAELQVESARQDEAQARLQVHTEVSQALDEASVARRQAAIADRSVALAEAAARMAGKGFGLGAVSNLEYQLAQQALAIARRQQSDARLNAVLAIEHLKAALGEPLP